MVENGLSRDFCWLAVYAGHLAGNNAIAGDLDGRDYWNGWGWAMKQAGDDATAGRPVAELARRNQARLENIAVQVGMDIERGLAANPVLLGKRAGCRMVEIHLQSRPPESSSAANPKRKGGPIMIELPRVPRNGSTTRH